MGDMYFTWRDLEEKLIKEKKNWPESWSRFEVYCDELIIYYHKQKNEEETEEFLKKCFGSIFREKEHILILSVLKKGVSLVYEQEEEELFLPKPKPLFQYYADAGENAGEQETKSFTDLQGVPVYAFHSYKGGVGRTLSLISMLKGITGRFGTEKKVLVIDADVEAPGLTWMLKEDMSAPVSYLDVLSMLYVYPDSEWDRLLDELADIIQENEFGIHTGEYRQIHYFLPVYRKESQLLSVFTEPEKLLYTNDNPYIVTETFSVLGKKLGADLVLVDLRAGISEYSAPYLFDKRVKKFFVSSTSLQSILGNQLVLEQIFRKTNLSIRNVQFILNMVPRDMEEEKRQSIMDKLVCRMDEYRDGEDETFLRDEYTMMVDFSSELLHLEDIKQTVEKLSYTPLQEKMNLYIKEEFSEPEEKKVIKEQDIRQFLQKLYSITDNEMTAEQNESENMLLTDSIQSIARNHKRKTPRIVVQGAKGAGKTYMYKQFLKQKKWSVFLERTGNRLEDKKEGFFLPFLAPSNRSLFQNLLNENMEYFRENFLGLNVKRNVYADIEEVIQSKRGKITDELEWKKIWEALMLKAMGGRFQTLLELDSYLEEKQKRVIFLIDGLEEILTVPLKIEEDGVLVRALCKRVMNSLLELDYGNIGLILFIRKDMAQNSITVNYEQFSGQYQKYELKWSKTEALRLALWFASKAFSGFGSREEVTGMGREELEKRLEGLWGKKMGSQESREANTARWVLGVLSDFTGQLQARDVVRFLRHSSSPYETVSIKHTDRYLMPAAMRKAVAPCSKEKLGEMEKEMPDIYQILEKLRDNGKKELPIELNKLELKGTEISLLEERGFLKRTDEGYFFPEIIRNFLGYQYGKGARPKVLSLTGK